MSRIILARLFFLMLTVAIVVTIGWFTSQTGAVSNALSTAFVYELQDRLKVNFSWDQVQQMNLVLRKVAHFSLYALLGCGTMAIGLTTRRKIMGCFVVAMLVCAVFAGFDEIRQFISGTRNGNVLDVLLDCCGSGFGCLMVAWLGIRLRSLKMRRSEKLKDKGSVNGE